MGRSLVYNYVVRDVKASEISQWWVRDTLELLRALLPESTLPKAPSTNAQLSKKKCLLLISLAATNTLCLPPIK